MKCQSYDSEAGKTGKVDIESESYLTTDRKLGAGEHETVDIDYRNHIIRIYSDAPWKVHSMNQNSRTVPVEVLENS